MAIPKNPISKTQLFVASMTLAASLQTTAAEAPLYKPSSASAEAVDISSNTYGASTLAPTAINVGEAAPRFALPVSGGGTYYSHDADNLQPLAVIFYRGHW